MPQIADWLEKLGMSEYAGRFAENRIDFSVQGKVRQARELLAPVYGWFTEGHDTRDLREAKALSGKIGVVSP